MTINDLYRKTKKITNDLQRSIKQNLIKSGKLKSNLIKKIKIKPVLEGESQISIDISMPDYAVFVDQGRRAGKQPPLNVIQKWCKRKGINVKAAFPIARKIGEEGIKPTYFLDPLRVFREKIYPQMVKDYKEAFKAELETKNIIIK